MVNLVGPVVYTRELPVSNKLPSGSPLLHDVTLGAGRSIIVAIALRTLALGWGGDQFDPSGVGIRPVNLFGHYREDFYVPPQRGKFTFFVSMQNSGSRPVIIEGLTATGIPRRATSRSALRAGRADRSTIARRSAYILGRAYSAIPDICVLRPRSRTVAGPPLLGVGAGGGCSRAG